ncbi:hypothetical protein Nhal_0388 [Nitrosococcus halophilus Nc 4]|uniref:Uncharacterized protein n=1 Tax=Nitrosococcus halophilus (strain Nc4) TaxID=472759 RepID=D5BVF2_NITHN|nr:hypothetical protein Nhal_0388 [Nitrosococcus halophilus Nc 4]
MECIQNLSIVRFPGQFEGSSLIAIIGIKKSRHIRKAISQHGDIGEPIATFFEQRQWIKDMAKFR